MLSRRHALLLAAFAASETVSYYTGGAQSSWNRRLTSSVDYNSLPSDSVPLSASWPLRSGRRPRLSGGLHSTATRDEAMSTAGVESTEVDVSGSTSPEFSSCAGGQDNSENSFTLMGTSRSVAAFNGGGSASAGRQKFVGTKAAKAVRSSESLQWTLKRMGEAPLLTAAQELELGARCLALGDQVAARRAAAASLGREPSGLEWAVAANFTGAKSALKFLQRAAAAAAAAAQDSAMDPAAQSAAVQAANQARLKADNVAVAFTVDHASNRAAKEELLNANMRLVVSIARRYQNLGVSLQDLVQEGCLGLIRAAEKYDPARGFRFATYASW